MLEAGAPSLKQSHPSGMHRQTDEYTSIYCLILPLAYITVETGVLTEPTKTVSNVMRVNCSVNSGILFPSHTFSM